MLYLEDYIELVEILPQELRDRFTEMRLLDLQGQNYLDQIQNKVNYFYQHAPNMTPEQRQVEYEKILQDYNRPLTDSEEKINLATQIQEFLNKYTRKLEQDIQKFKLELEADNSGITEILEKRVTDSQQKENQRNNLLLANNNALRNKMNIRNSRSEMNSSSVLPSNTNSINDKRLMNDRLVNQNNDYKYSISHQNYNTTSGGSLSSPSNVSIAQNSINYSLSNIGAGGIAITAAASQAIAATQQMKQGRRTASLKASYEAAIHGAGSSTADMNISKELAGAAQTAIAAIQDTHKKNKKKSTTNLSMGTINMNTSSALHSLMIETSTNNKVHSSATSSSSSTLGAASLDDISQQPLEEELESGYGPDEPRYCQCNEVAFGVMVACDNKSCPYEWYHCECVGIAPDNPPKGKWYCHICLEMLNKNKQSSSGNFGSNRKHRKT